MQAQNRKGITLDNSTNWQQVLEKAKIEKKSILVDCNTTWCVWCKWLENRIFTDSSVGDILNKNFIVVKIQFDTSKNDNEYVKSWYKDANSLLKKYQIKSFPTQLFFNESGIIIHKIVGANSKAGVQGYLNAINRSLSPDSQFYTLVRKYKKEKNSSELLKKLTLASFQAGEYHMADTLYKRYLTITNDEKYSQEKIKFIVQMLHSIHDTSFAIIYHNYNKFDSITKDPIASDEMRKVIFYDDISHIIFRGKGQVENYRYPLKEPKWNEIETILNKKYTPQLSDEILLYSKLQFYKDQYQWEKYFNMLKYFVEKYKRHINSKAFMGFANDILLFSNDIKEIKFGITLIEQSENLNKCEQVNELRIKLEKRLNEYFNKT